MRAEPVRSSRRLVALALLLGGAAAACEDAPTVPPALQRYAGGEEWVAVSVPAELPRVEGWVRYLPRSTPEGRAALAELRALQRAAEFERQHGRLDEAAALHRDAERLIVSSLGEAPGPRVLERAILAIDLWTARVRGAVALERAPAMAATLSLVEAERAAASELLAAGDTLGAARQIAAATSRIRDHAPEAVALRVLDRAEARLRAAARRGPRERALHLLNTAREALAVGDATRALQRALYALQIAEGSEVRTVDAASDSACGEAAC